MKGILVDNVGGDYHLADDIPKPSLGPNRVLVKSIYGAANPVDEFLRGSGVLVTSWPLTPGADVSGTIVEVGDEVTSLKVGDQVFGCAGVGYPGSGTAAEYCAFTEGLVFKKPEHLSMPEAVTFGVGIMTAGLAIYQGLNVALPDPQNLPAASDEWIFVIGGGGSVGGFAIQLAKMSGYNVIASVSAKSAGAAVSYGADETVDYKSPLEEQIAKIKEVTKGGLHRIFDSTPFNINVVKAVLEAIKEQPGQKYFATVNDWEDFGPLPGDAKSYPTSLGPVSRPEFVDLNKDMAKVVKVIQPLIDSGKVKPSEYVIIGDGASFENFIEGNETLKKAPAKKVVYKLQDE